MLLMAPAVISIIDEYIYDEKFAALHNAIPMRALCRIDDCILSSCRFDDHLVVYQFASDLGLLLRLLYDEMVSIVVE